MFKELFNGKDVRARQLCCYATTLALVVEHIQEEKLIVPSPTPQKEAEPVERDAPQASDSQQLPSWLAKEFAEAVTLPIGQNVALNRQGDSNPRPNFTSNNQQETEMQRLRDENRQVMILVCFFPNSGHFRSSMKPSAD